MFVLFVSTLRTVLHAWNFILSPEKRQDSAFLIFALKVYFKLQVSRNAVFNDGY